VLLSSKGKMVYAFEGFPVAQARTMRAAIAAIQTSGPIFQADAPKASPDLTSGLTHLAATLNLAVPLTSGRYTSQGK
jgi:hypothetical protein